MKFARLIGFILAAMLMVNSFVGAPAIAQQSDAGALYEKAAELLRAGKFSEAMPLAQRALVIWEKALGPDHPDFAIALNNLAVLYANQDRYADAEPLFWRALAILEKAFGPDYRDVALLLNNLANLYRAQGRYADAEPLSKRAIAIREKTKLALAMREKARGPDYSIAGVPAAAQQDEAAALDKRVGELYRAGKFSEAVPLAQQALAIREKARGPDHLSVATTLNDVADLYRAQGRYADAEPLYSRALTIREKARGPNHPEVAQSLNNLADLCRAQGRYTDAEPLYKRALSILEKEFGPDHRAVVLLRYNLADLYRAQGRDADAEPLSERAPTIREKALGPDHPNAGVPATTQQDKAASPDERVEELFRADKFSEAMPLSQPAIPQPPTSPEQRRCRASRWPSSMPARGRFWCRTDRSIRRPPAHRIDIRDHRRG